MIPINLHIQGFLSYKEPVVINFENIHLASITGANGAGKSSILDAITWVMFGNARARNDLIINQQSDTAIVSLDFLYEKQKFRIRRTKPLEKTMLLEFYIFDGESESWRTLTEHAIQETQKRIHSTLRMDYNTFTNASFFLQGKADQFTRLTPGDRKDILSNILGLEIWEDYQKITKEIRKKFEIELVTSKKFLEDIENEIGFEEQTKSNLSEAEIALAEKKKIKAIQNELMTQGLQLEKAKEATEKQIDQLRNDIGKLTQSFEKNQNRKSKLVIEISELNRYLENSSQIEEKYLKWQSLRKELEIWNEKSTAFHKIKNELTIIKNEIENQINQRKSSKLSLENNYQQVEKFRQQIPELNEEIDSLNKQLQEIEVFVNQKYDLNEHLMNVQNIITEKQSTIKHLEKENSDKRNQLKEFRKAGVDCPFCMQPLTEEHRKKYEELVITDGKSKNERIQELNNVITGLKKETVDISDRLRKIDEQEKFLRIVHSKLAEKRTNHERMMKEITDWESDREGTYHQVVAELENETFLTTFLTKRESLESALEKINYLENDHQNCKEQEIKLRDVESEYQKLMGASTSIAPLNQQLKDIDDDLAHDDNELALKKELLKQVQLDFEVNYSNLPDITLLRKELDSIDKEISQINNRIGAERQKLDTIERKKNEKIRVESDINDLIVKINRYKKVEDACSKNGVPALLIEQALPEIEMRANEILDRLSNSQLSIHFETQSEYKDKKRQDKRETLDILINDANGKSRAYEMFSGGEAFRINFAIRLALSQVLAKRSGARLETLVVDEGFGSQDSSGRDRLVETINLIKNDFAKLLIITHLEELKDAFPARIEVEKTTSGSQVKVMVY
ncbi:MAG TPA: SMC family ATPase [Anaerolineaceae bacterium]|nr:SMC family ATPase [Anaerolineaceae bacterium]